ncbi:MAG: hypothetical protein VYE40_10570 [Myxococcota bacterium]|jgi:hypothetical protein|nr:hypothetical protein [Myxococcota bacterium]
MNPTTRTRNALAIGTTAELAASISLLGFGPALWSSQAPGWEIWTLGLVMGCLLILTLARMAQTWVLSLEEGGTWRRKVAIGFGISLAGWIGLIALFMLKFVRPELMLPTWLYFVAFATHISGALYALKQLGRI